MSDEIKTQRALWQAVDSLKHNCHPAMTEHCRAVEFAANAAIDCLQSQLAAANERADAMTAERDAAVKALEDARGQVPAAYETRWAGKGGPYAWGSGFLHKIYPDAVADGTEIRALYAAPVPAQPAAIEAAIERTALLAKKVAGKETADKIRREVIMRDDFECPMCKRYNHVS